MAPTAAPPAADEPTPRPQLAHEVVVTRGPGGRPFSFTVNGEVFPHLIDADHGIGVHLSRDDVLGAITVTILARTVRVVDEVGVGAEVPADAPADFDG